MEEYLNELNLIDLVSEKHKKLREEVMNLWIEKDGEDITDTEAHLLGMLNRKSMTIAESARKINVTRQAAHKCAKKLIEEGYIVMKPIEGNKRDKLIVLTDKGNDYCIAMLKVKEHIEKKISSKLGKENIEIIKILLRKDWIDE